MLPRSMTTMAPMRGLTREAMIRSDDKVGGVGDLPMSHVNLQDPEAPLMHRDEMATEFANQVGPSGERLTETG
jgi:hypothetical protein